MPGRAPTREDDEAVLGMLHLREGEGMRWDEVGAAYRRSAIAAKAACNRALRELAASGIGTGLDGTLVAIWWRARRR